MPTISNAGRTLKVDRFDGEQQFSDFNQFHVLHTHTKQQHNIAHIAVAPPDKFARH
jgi:hypothetical protein